MMDTGRLYGDSLYDLAAEEKLTETLMEQLEMVAEVLKENPEYLTLLSEPSIPKTERVGLLDKAFEGQLSLYLLNFLKLLCESGMLREYRDSCRQFGEQVHPYLLNFFKILCSEGIVRSFSGCSREFRRRYNEDHNIAEALIVTAVALKEEQREALKARLEKISGKTVIMKEKQEPQVLGGIRVELEGIALDGTLENRLDNLRKQITEN